MTQIIVTPLEVRNTGNEITRKKEELEDTIRRAKQVMDSLRDGFKGRRADSIFGEWERIYPNLTKSFENLQSAGQLLESAAQAFEDADTAVRAG
jgi:WXG100 family type VII secretion target